MVSNACVHSCSNEHSGQHQLTTVNQKRDRESERQSSLLTRYGEMLTLDELAAVLKYPSRQALHQAQRRGRLPVNLIRLPKRRGWFASTREIAKFLDDSLRPTNREGDAMK